MGAGKVSVYLLGLSLVAGCRVGAFDELSAGYGADAAGADAASEVDAAERDADETEPDEDAASDAALSDADGTTSLDATTLDTGTPLDTGNPLDTSSQLDTSSPVDTGGGGPDAADAAVEAAAPDAGPITRVFVIAQDQDDALWRQTDDGLEELLNFDPDTQGSADFTIEVGTDYEDCRAGLRFSLPFARGTQIVSARLSMTRVGAESNVKASSSMRVSVFESDNVPAFVSGHAHATPAAHVPGGVWSTSIGGFSVGPTASTTTSQDLRLLVQHVLDRSNWTSGAYIGFLLSPDTFAAGEYMQIVDFQAPTRPPAQLSVTYYE